MARRERVLAGAAESRQRARREIVKPARKSNKETSRVKQTRSPFWMGSWTEERAAVCCDVNMAAELFCACEEGHSYAYQGTQGFFDLGREFQQESSVEIKMQMESIGRGRVNVTGYRGCTTGVGGSVRGDLPFSSFLPYCKACPAAWWASLASAAPKTLLPVEEPPSFFAVPQSELHFGVTCPLPAAPPGSACLGHCWETPQLGSTQAHLAFKNNLQRLFIPHEIFWKVLQTKISRGDANTWNNIEVIDTVSHWEAWKMICFWNI